VYTPSATTFTALFCLQLFRNQQFLFTFIFLLEVNRATTTLDVENVTRCSYLSLISYPVLNPIALIFFLCRIPIYSWFFVPNFPHFVNSSILLPYSGFKFLFFLGQVPNKPLDFPNLFRTRQHIPWQFDPPVTAAATAQVKLCPYDEEEPHIWFCLIKAQFAAVGIKSQKLKYANALASLPKQVLWDILDTLDVCNDSAGPFDFLKNTLLGQFGKSKWQSDFELLRLPMEKQGLKGTVQRKLTGVVSYISQEVFRCHRTADISFLNFNGTCSLNSKKPVSAVKAKICGLSNSMGRPLQITDSGKPISW
jgi:hypothetical protein